MLRMLGMLLVSLLALFTLGSGLCAMVGLVQLFFGGGPFFAVAGAVATVVSFFATTTLYESLLSRPPEGPDEPRK